MRFTLPSHIVVIQALRNDAFRAASIEAKCRDIESQSTLREKPATNGSSLAARAIRGFHWTLCAYQAG